MIDLAKKSDRCALLAARQHLSDGESHLICSLLVSLNDLYERHATAEQERDFLRREVDSLREQYKQRLENAMLQLRSVEAQRDEFLKVIAEGRALEPPPPITIQQDTELRKEVERLKEVEKWADEMLIAYGSANLTNPDSMDRLDIAAEQLKDALGRG